MAVTKSVLSIVGMVLVALDLSGLPARGAATRPVTEPVTQPASQPTSQPSPQTTLVKKGTLAREIQAEGVFAAVDPFEVRLRLKSFPGPLTVVSAAGQGVAVKKGELLLECETTDIKWAMETAESGLAVARAGLQKTELDGELAVKADALVMRMQQDAVKNAEAAVKYWETTDGPHLLATADLQVQTWRQSVEDQEDELNELRKMYKSEELTNVTADIVVKRAVRRLEISKINLKIQEERREKFKANDYAISRQRVLDALEQVRQALTSLKISQDQAAVTRKNGLTVARIAVEQAEQRLGQLKGDLAELSVKAPSDGMVLYGQLPEVVWKGNEVRGLRPGDKLAAGQVVMRVVASGPMRVEVGLSESQAFWLEGGAKAAVVPLAFPQLSYEAACPNPVAVPKMPPSPIGFQLPLVLSSVDRRLLPGMKATVRIDIPRSEATVVPLTAIAGGKATVRKSDGKTEERTVAVGRSDGQLVEIISGLNVGEEVLTQAKKP